MRELLPAGLIGRRALLSKDPATASKAEEKNRG
jgi:hypothetical protein